MTPEQIRQAVYNNAVWCDTVCRAHGRSGEFHDGIWINRRKTPLYYPNAVTLSEEHDSAAQMQHIRALDTAELAGAWGVAF